MTTSNVNIDFITAALDARFEDKKGLWGCEASIALWDSVLEIVEECGIGESCGSPSEYADNYLINGEFVTRDEMSASDAESYCIELDDDGTISNDEWTNFCCECIASDDRYACKQF